MWFFQALEAELIAASAHDISLFHGRVLYSELAARRGTPLSPFVDIDERFPEVVLILAEESAFAKLTEKILVND